MVTESILESKMEMSFDSQNKVIAKQEAHELELEPVPMLLLGSKPAGKNDGDNSVRTSSPAPPDGPSTPTKGLKKAQSSQVRERLPSVRRPILSSYVILIFCSK